MVIEWIGLMRDSESATRDSRRFQTRLRAAKLRKSGACMEDVDYRAARQRDRALFRSLQNGAWITRHRSILITGPCGVGKSWLPCAPAYQTCGYEACRQGKTTLYFRMPRLFGELAVARGDGSFERIFRKIVRADVFRALPLLQGSIANLLIVQVQQWPNFWRKWIGTVVRPEETSMSHKAHTYTTNVQHPGLQARYIRILDRLRERAAQQSVYRQKVAELQAFSDRDLADFGYHRSEIPRIARESVGLA